eukprot:CAMPEP_0201612160 /NCGR_PEP_ID=MMETSP0492-20130828/22286_1 /ASSEMBLY_ACC=CAM_ASM_000837 /TAXON_ID=420259 /ORGANISM="Thalassiosira gravida, Strain GMp14c1" /LENGTH=133 /DNA_ID=CAMNT_0048078581 /DNA_START=127 /DNA_END=525 /DNA_ORIENTATION=+
MNYCPMTTDHQLFVSHVRHNEKFGTKEVAPGFNMVPSVPSLSKLSSTFGLKTSLSFILASSSFFFRKKHSASSGRRYAPGKSVHRYPCEGCLDQIIPARPISLSAKSIRFANSLPSSAVWRYHGLMASSFSPS